jgi:DNA-binding beta-propeller fold protein YncE
MPVPSLRANSSSPRRHASWVLALSALAAMGCAGARKSSGEVVWPYPPDKPRVRFVRSFSRAEHMKSSIWRSIGNSIVPRDPHTAIRQPTGLALSPDEKRLYVACGPTSTVLEVDLEASTMETIADASGHKPRGPHGIAVDASDSVYVSDKVDGVVLVYAKDGSFVRKIGAGKLVDPMAIAIDRRRQLLYVLSGAARKQTSHQVEVFSLAGAHLRTIGRRGAGPGEFNFPTALTVAPDGRLFVSDMLNFRIQIFSPDGALLGMFGQIGQFDKMKATALDAFGNIYVVDSGHRSVMIFNSDFQHLLTFAGDGFMQLPTQLVITSKNQIYVSDHVGHQVAEFALVNTTATDSRAPKAPSPSVNAPSPTTGGTGSRAPTPAVNERAPNSVNR